MASILSYGKKQRQAALLKCSILLYTSEKYYCTRTSWMLRSQELGMHFDFKTKLYLFRREDGSSRILRSIAVLHCISKSRSSSACSYFFVWKRFIVCFQREYKGVREDVSKWGLQSLTAVIWIAPRVSCLWQEARSPGRGTGAPTLPGFEYRRSLFRRVLFSLALVFSCVRWGNSACLIGLWERRGAAPGGSATLCGTIVLCRLFAVDVSPLTFCSRCHEGFEQDSQMMAAAFPQSFKR